MICKRIGCTEKMRSSNSALVTVFDERKIMPTSGDYLARHISNPKQVEKLVAEYKANGHEERWCRTCITKLEPHKYRLTYYVDNRQLKLRRHKLADVSAAYEEILSDPIAPIVGTDVETIEETPAPLPRKTSKKVGAKSTQTTPSIE